MPKNIVLCSDGTGQAGGQGFVSNVWRLFKAVDRHHDTQQIVFHADGVGTEKNRILRALGGAFGYGLSADICSLYGMLVKSYSVSENKADNIFLFGFSRGAFTVRSLAGMIDHIGILDSQAFDSDEEIAAAVKQAYHAYRKGVPLPGISIHASRKIKFVGVWDTVDAIGVPVDELREIIYWLARSRFIPHKDELNASIENAYHALSIDDERKTFHPRIWKEESFAGNVEQLWFAGVHSNVGGGYPKDSLSFISLDWMMKNAHDCGLKFCDSKWRALSSNNQFGDYQEQADKNGRIYDSRAGLALYYRYRPRKIKKLWAAGNPDSKPNIHESVLMRIKSGYTNYAPTALPQSFNFLPTWSHDLQQISLDLDLGDAWACIRKRVMLYLALIATTLLFVLTGFIGCSDKVSSCGSKQICSSVLKFFKDKLPGFMNGWLEFYAANPLMLGGFVVTFAILYVSHIHLKKLTQHYADKAWRESSEKLNLHSNEEGS